MAAGTLERLVPSQAFDLGVVRAIICGLFFCSVLTTSFTSLAELPVTLLRPVGVMKLLPWTFYDWLLTSAGIRTLQWLLLLSLVGSSIGWFTSLTSKIAAVAVIFYQGLLRSFTHFNHDEMLGVYLLVVLAFTPCAEAFSVDSWRRKASAKAGFRYSYPLLLMMCLVAWSYFSSALLKLRSSGLNYFSSDNLPVLAIYHSLDNLHDTQFKVAFLLPQYRSALSIISGIVLLWELLFPMAIVWKRARWPILGFGIIFHLSTLVIMNIFFPFHLAMYAVFVNWSAVFTTIKNWLPNQKSDR